MIVRVHRPGQAQLSHIAQALDALGLRLGFAQRGQKQPRQDRDDGDDDEQFDQREGQSRR